MNQPIISDIQFRPYHAGKNGHIGFVSLIYDGNLKLDDIAVYTRLKPKDGQGPYYLVYPVNPNTKHRHVCFPVNRSTGELIEKEVTIYIDKLLKN